MNTKIQQDIEALVLEEQATGLLVRTGYDRNGNPKTGNTRLLADAVAYAIDCGVLEPETFVVDAAERMAVNY
jgi:hypothetical protein